MGEGAPLSATSLQRLKEKWEGEYEQWRSESIEEKDWAYLWADGIYVKAGIGKEKAALLVVVGVKRGGSKRFFLSGSKLEKSSGLKFQSPGAEYLYFREIGGAGDQSGGVDGYS